MTHLAGTILGMYMLLAGAHTIGHVEEGRVQGVDVQVDAVHYREVWQKDNSNKSARIHNAGFVVQDRVKEAAEEEKSVYIADAIYKVVYLCAEDSPKFVPRRGDTDFIGDVKGKQAKQVMQSALLLTAAIDVYKYSRKDSAGWNIYVWQSQSGTPGVILSVRY